MQYAGAVVLLNAILAIDAVVAPLDADGSKCAIYVSERRPRYVPYTETYKVRKWGFLHQTQTRVNFRLEYTTAWVSKTVCCTGYEDRDGRCEPICSAGCANGHCVKPETCECYQGYGSSNDTGRLACTPVCDGGCGNGYCESPDRCACHTGYRPTDDWSGCAPVCAQDCERNNARCVAPDTCECQPGYRSDDSSVAQHGSCAPICEVACANGECTAPNNCTCRDGYAAVNAFDCEPKCERPCVFGRCAMPNTCVCDHGYRSTEDGVCEPICAKPCVKGTCVAPDSCRCDDGYGLLDSSVYECVPICSQTGCLNGVCSSDGACVCNEGYAAKRTEEGEQMCLPLCEISCAPFGKCVAPDTCSCLEGYRAVLARLTEIEVPDGDNSLRAASVCRPVCETPCGPNSACTEPNFCSCNVGYGRTENDVENVCEPICDAGCGPNATCAAPNTCACNEGHERDGENRCAPVCTDCRNGVCVAPNVCQCTEGYVLTNESICVQPCGNDSATANQCQRRDGFETSEGNGTAVESCTKVCKGHGVCTHDESPCECSYGWTGRDCDQPAVCILLVDPQDQSLEGLAVHNETNSTLADARRYAPYCYQCNETVGNKSFCFATNTEDGSPTVGCFVETGSPCRSMYHGNTGTASAMAGTLAVTTISIMAAAATVAYFALRRYRRKRMREAIARSALFQGCIANETLLSEEDT